MKSSSSKSIRALISYHRIFTGTGLPLYRLTATSPEITLPVTATNTAAIALPRPGTPTIDALEEALQALSRICWRVEAVDAAVRYADGVDFANHVGIVAYRTRREPFRWRLGFSGALLEAPVPGAQVSGKFTLGQGENVAAGEFGHGEVWTWNVPLEGFEVEGFSLVGTIQNDVKFLLHDDGSVSGQTESDAQKLVLASTRLAAPIDLGAYSLHTGFEITDGKYAFTKIVLRRVNTTVLSGSTELAAFAQQALGAGDSSRRIPFRHRRGQTAPAVGSPSAGRRGRYAQPAQTRQSDGRRCDAGSRTRRNQDRATRDDSQEPGGDRHCRGHRVRDSRGHETAAGRGPERAADLLERLADDYARQREVRQLRGARPHRQRQSRERSRGRGLQDQCQRRRRPGRAFPRHCAGAAGVAGAAARSPRALERPRPSGHQRIGKVDGQEPRFRPSHIKCVPTLSAPS